MISTTNTKTNP